MGQTYLYTILVLIQLIFYSAQSFSQQPIGKTGNVTIENDSWRISSQNGMDGSTGGSLFIENFPYIHLDKNQSYWVAGFVKMQKSGNYQEVNEYFSSQVCNGLTTFIHPQDTMLNEISQASMFFQIFHGDLGGFQRLGNESERFRIFFNTFGKGGIWHKAKSESLKDSLNEGDYIKFIMAFVLSGDSLDDPLIPSEFKSGSFIYFQILDSLGNLKKFGRPIPPQLCYNPYDSAKGDGTYRIYIGSDSHGNIQDQEASIKKWMEGLSTGDTNCEYRPSGMNPILGQIYRMIFVQRVLSYSDINSFFDDPMNYFPNSDIKLDFPKIIEDKKGYSIYIPNSHWEDYTQNPGQNGDIASRLFYHVPNTGGPRNGIRTTYTDTLNPLDFGIIYKVNERLEKTDTKNQTISFYLGSDDIKFLKPEFYFTINLNVFNSNNPADSCNIYINCSPLFQNVEWTYPNLNVPLSASQGGNDYFEKFEISIQDLLTEYANLIGCNRLDFLNFIIINGVFDLAGLTLYNPTNNQTESNTGTVDNYGFNLSNNYPNPFNSSTRINYSIPTKLQVKLDIYDILGQKVATLINEIKSSGSYFIDFNSGKLVSGVYFYKFISGNYTKVMKMLLMK